MFLSPLGKVSFLSLHSIIRNLHNSYKFVLSCGCKILKFPDESSLETIYI